MGASTNGAACFGVTTSPRGEGCFADTDGGRLIEISRPTPFGMLSPVMLEDDGMRTTGIVGAAVRITELVVTASVIAGVTIAPFDARPERAGVPPIASAVPPLMFAVGIDTGRLAPPSVAAPVTTPLPSPTRITSRFGLLFAPTVVPVGPVVRSGTITSPRGAGSEGVVASLRIVPLPVPMLVFFSSRGRRPDEDESLPNPFDVEYRLYPLHGRHDLPLRIVCLPLLPSIGHVPSLQSRSMSFPCE